MKACSKSASQSTKASLQHGTLLQNRYEIVRQLGRGGMGAVYEALDKRLGIKIAIKETLSTDPSARNQFETEARLLATMQHPALPRVTDHFVEGDRAFLVMQFIEGVDLASIIARQAEPFSRDQVIAWADQLLDALIYLHSRDRKVIHRDIKPHNLKLTTNGNIALLDFGLAKAQPADTSLTASRAYFGYTRHYAPLEQIQDQRTDHRSDIYALGATLYHLLTGKKPPDAFARATSILDSEPDPLVREIRFHPALDAELGSILRKAMALKPEDRFESAEEFREALKRVGRIHEPGAATPAQECERPISSHHLDRPELNMAMVVSARRFGPGAVTALVVVAMALAVGIPYGSRSWLRSSDAVVPGAMRSQGSQLESGVSRRPEKRVGYITNVSSNKTSGVLNTNKNRGEGNLRPRATNEDSKNTKPVREKRKVNAPSIRLPKPEVAETVTMPVSDAGIRSFGSANVPQFFRTADGTQIIKFSDGTTRVIKPGARSSE